MTAIAVINYYHINGLHLFWEILYLDLARELKKLWNMRMTVILIVIGALRKVPKGLVKGLEELEIGGRIKTTRKQHCCDRPEYWEESGRSVEIWWYSDSRERPSINAGMKKDNGPSHRAKENVEHESDSNTNGIRGSWNNLWVPEKETRWRGD